jgi:hypothetical protein
MRKLILNQDQTDSFIALTQRVDAHFIAGHEQQPLMMMEQHGFL